MIITVNDNNVLKTFNIIDSSAIAEVFDSTQSYAIGDYCVYGNTLYKFVDNHNAGAWSSSDVTQVLITDELASLGVDISQKYEKPSGGIPASDLASAVQTSLGKADTALQSAPVEDVQIEGTSIISNRVAEIPAASASTFGVVKTDATLGSAMSNSGVIYPVPAASNKIKQGTQQFQPIVPEKQHEAVFYGLAKAAGQDMASSNNNVGTYTTEAKTAIKSMLGVADTPPEIYVGTTTPSGYTVYIDPEGFTAVGEGVSF